MPNLDPLLAPLDADQSRETAGLFLDLVAGYLAETAAGIGPVTTGQTPEQLAIRFAEPLPQDGRPIAEVIRRLEREVLPEVTRLTHPMYMGHQVSAPLPAAIWTEALISAVNNSTAVQEMAPPTTIIEHQLVRWLSELVGWGPESGGTLTSGGTEATFTALLAARAAAMPDAWEDGVGDSPPVVLYGEQSHYAVTRAIAQLGLGLRRGIAIPARNHCMDVPALVGQLNRLEREGPGSWRWSPPRAPLQPAASTTSNPSGGCARIVACGSTSMARTARRRSSQPGTGIAWRGSTGHGRSRGIPTRPCSCHSLPAW